MKAVILAGGFGTRLGDLTESMPKPMVRIGSKPVLLHLMEIYAKNGITDFVILGGYKAEILKNYFFNLLSHVSDFTIDLKTESVTFHSPPAYDWKVTVLDTGIDSNTAVRLQRASAHLITEPYFHLTYGDGLGNLDLRAAERQFLDQDCVVQISTVLAPSKFGQVTLEGSKVTHFGEKHIDSNRINAGFMVCSNRVFDHLDTFRSLEEGTLPSLAQSGLLGNYEHNGFWHPMDTPKDVFELTELAGISNCPWLVDEH